MIRSVNVFTNGRDFQFPIRVEFWQDDKMVDRRDVDSIDATLAKRISDFVALR